MKTFEQQLSDSACRLRDANNYRLPAPRRPYRRPAWGWLTTPAAAVVGVLVGTGLPHQTATLVPQVAEVRVTDTVVRERTVRDTIYLPAPAAPRPPHTVPHGDVPASASADVADSPDTSGCNVRCDGVDYSLLVRL